MSRNSDAFAALRRVVSPYARASDAAGLAVALSAFAVYLTSLAVVCCVRGFWRWPAFGVEAFCVGSLFIIGHDACHLALVRSARLNRWIARIAFVPSLHPFTAWEIGHNRRHHGFTNLRGVDYVWCPWSPKDYESAADPARLLYRLYHTPIGIGLYYPIEIWIKRMWRDDDSKVGERDRRLVARDRAFAAVGFAAVALGSFGLGIVAGFGVVAAALDAALCVLGPLALFHYLMSVVIFIHHRHPSVVWRDSHEAYSPYEGQVKGTIHATMPRLAELSFLDIFQHTAHHVNARIPLYSLASAQRLLSRSAAGAVTTIPLSFSYALRVMRECQLYDYERQRWLRIPEPARAVAGGQS